MWIKEAQWWEKSCLFVCLLLNEYLRFWISRSQPRGFMFYHNLEGSRREDIPVSTESAALALRHLLGIIIIDWLQNSKVTTGGCRALDNHAWGPTPILHQYGWMDGRKAMLAWGIFFFFNGYFYVYVFVTCLGTLWRREENVGSLKTGICRRF